MWVNDVTGETSEVDPTSASIDRSSSAMVAANSDLMSGAIHYNTRRNKLAERGRYCSVNAIALVRSKADPFSDISEVRHLDTISLLRIPVAMPEMNVGGRV